MTEWEKLQNGLIYNDFDNDLFQRRVAAKKLFRVYNRTEDEDVELRQQIMSELFKVSAKMCGSNRIFIVSSAKIS